MTAQALATSTGVVGLSAPARAEGIVAAGRAVLATGSILAMWLDPSEPARFATLAYATLGAYVVYALVLLVWVMRARLLPARFGIATHALDLIFVTTLQVFTDAASSPFFAYFIFALVAAALRWQRRGVLWTGPIVLAAFLVLGVVAVPLLGDPSFESNRFIIRATYLAVVGALITYLGGHEERLRSDLSRLAAWPRGPGRSPATEIAALLAQAAGVLGAGRVVMVWEEEEEPWVHLATWSPSSFEQTREPPGAFASLVPEALSRRAFLCLDAGEPAPTIIYPEGHALRQASGAPPVHPDLMKRLGMGALLSAPVEGEVITGRIFFLEVPRMSADDLALASAVAQYVAAGMDRASLLEQLQDAAAMRERTRVAHDLHDGVLQSLTGVELKLEALRGLLDKPELLRARLDEVVRIVGDEHAELRAFIRTLPRAAGLPGEPFALGPRLEALAGRVTQHWDVAVKLSVDRLPVLPPELARHVYLMAREAMLNAARHADASAVTVEASGEGGQLRIAVADDGRGFGFEGRLDQAELARRDLGPRSLLARVDALGGRMTIESGSRGSRLEMSLPIGKG